MAKVKKQKVLRFKNTPIKKEEKKKNLVTKKKIVTVPKQTEGLTDSTEELTKTSVATPSTPVADPVQPPPASNSATAIPSSDAFLEPEFEKETKINRYFPSISRVITEKWFLIGLVSGILLVAIIIVAGNIQANIEERKNLEQKRTKIKQEITYWQESARKYPGYRDAYFQLALLEYQLGDAQSAQSYLNKVESIDPNFQEAYTLEKLLSSQK